MRNKIIRLTILLILIGICFYFYYIGFNQNEQNSSVLSRINVTLTSPKPRKPISVKHYVDFSELARDLREYSKEHNEILEKELFPWWIHNRTAKIGDESSNKRNKSKGIVICTGNKHYRLTLVALSSLSLIGNELPIEVVYSTSNDLSRENREELVQLFPNIRLIDLSKVTLNDSYLELRGWEIKPFSVLSSQFDEVLLMDSDVLFLEKPSILFENSFYLKTGSLFFYDRPDLSEDTIRWIRTLISPNDNRTIPRRTQESGVVLIDKTRVFDALLSICKLNDHHEREQVTYKRLYGDKDTWWLGFHIIGIEYSFIPTLTAAIGQFESSTKNRVCGHILHLDENKKPIWWNGGMFRNRYMDQSQLLLIQGWIYEGSWNIKAYSCLTNNGETAKDFNQDQIKLIDQYQFLTKKVFNIK